MIGTVAPPRQEAKAVTFEQALCDVWDGVEKLLEEMPTTTMEARRLITKELSFEPRPEELQTIVKMAEDSADKGLRRELPRSLLSLRVLAERELGVLLGENRLEADRIELAIALLPRIGREAERLDKRLQSSSETMAGLTVEDRDYLLHVGDALRCPMEVIQVAMLLAPRLLLFLEMAIADDPDERKFGLSKRELATIRCAVRTSDECDSQPSRICINALAIRSIIEDDLRTWEQTFSEERPDEETLQAREAAIERLQADKIAYQCISERLQRQQDLALVAGLTAFASEMRDLARSMFAVNLNLAHALREGATPVGEADCGSGVEDAGLPEKQRTVEETTDRMANKKVSKEEIILNALKKLENETDQAPELPRIDDPRRRRRRTWLMSGAALLLLVISALVHLLLLSGPGGNIDVSAADFETSLQLAQVDSVGRMMHARVIGWMELTEQERMSKMEELSRQTSAKGFTVLYVVDDSGNPAATWSKENGVELK